MSLIPPQEQVINDTEICTDDDGTVRCYALEIARLRGVVRSLYMETITTEDAGEFVLGVRGDMHKLIESWGETPVSAEEYMEQQRVAEERAQDERELKRLQEKLSK